jgi:hypothetical protein
MNLARYNIIIINIMIVNAASASAEPRSQGLKMKKSRPWDESMHYPLGVLREK